MDINWVALLNQLGLLEAESFLLLEVEETFRD